MAAASKKVSIGVKLSPRIKELLIKEKFSDVTLIVGEKLIKTHKFLLAGKFFCYSK
jgi:hypothetical protein